MRRTRFQVAQDRFNDPRRRRKRARRADTPEQSGNGEQRTGWSPPPQEATGEGDVHLPASPTYEPEMEGPVEPRDEELQSQVPEVQVVPPGGLSPGDAELSKLRNQISRLEREIVCHQNASNDWEAAPGFVVETIPIGVDITNTGEEHPPAARVYHFVAKHPERKWESDHYIDKGHAIRKTWECHLEFELEEITKERDELQRRWDQRKKTEESKKSKGDKDKGDQK